MIERRESTHLGNMCSDYGLQEVGLCASKSRCFYLPEQILNFSFTPKVLCSFFKIVLLLAHMSLLS